MRRVFTTSKGDIGSEEGLTVVLCMERRNMRKGFVGNICYIKILINTVIDKINFQEVKSFNVTYGHQDLLYTFTPEADSKGRKREGGPFTAKIKESFNKKLLYNRCYPIFMKKEAGVCYVGNDEKGCRTYYAEKGEW